MTPIRLNLGAGPDRAEGMLAIDANPDTGPDLVLDLARERLTDHFSRNTVSFILAQDVLEHLHRWEALRVLGDSFLILEPGGILQVRMPDAETILQTSLCNLEEKLTLLYGGQDRPVDRDPVKNRLRAAHPEYFAHHFGWTPKAFHQVLADLGYQVEAWVRVWPNFLTTAFKPKPPQTTSNHHPE